MTIARDLGIGRIRADNVRFDFTYIRIYINPMDISFDPAKDARNVARRGLSFARAADFDWAGALILEDKRREYGEQRF